MRIQRLNLAAFGHFTERVLVFDEPGLHIIHGSNEAGKSSALRGLKALLYGIDERTLDNFLHANDKLRIHGVLRTADGQELDFVRRKGRKNTLLTPGGEALGAEVLAPFLQGVTAELFATLFGIDHRALVQGGQEILAQQGEVGQALFSAALGSPALHKVLAELEETAKGLFLPSASKPTINAAIRAHAELRTGIRKISLSSTTWNDHQRILAATTRELEKIESQLSDKRLELTRLQRIQRILPKLARRRELNQELAALGDVRILAEDLGSRRLTALNMLETAETIFNKATARLGGLQEQREGLTVNEALLGQADSIEALYARLDSYRKALQNRPRLVAESQQLHIKGARILNEARPDLSLGDVGPLRSVLARRQQLTELATEQVSLHSREEQAQRSLNDINKRLDEARKEHAAIEEPGSTAGLRRAIAAARKQGDLDSLIQSTQHGITRLRSDCDTALARLGLWQGALEAVPVLALPGRESIQRFEDADDELLERSRRLEDKRDELSKALADASRRLAEIEGAGEVPTEAALSSARSARDGVWQLLRRQWLDGEDVSAEADAHQAEGLPLPEVFEQRLAGADELSDRLRREAERVHALATVRAKQEHDQQQADELAVQLEASQAGKAQLAGEWQTLWAPCQIVPQSPREMRAWLERFELLRAQVSDLSLQKQKLQEMEETRSTHIERLNEQLSALGRPVNAAAALEEVLLECETLEEQLESSRRVREALAKEVKDREAAVASLAEEYRLASEELDQWQLQWAEQMQSLGLQGDTPPARLGDFVESVRSLFSTLDDAEKLQQHIREIDQDTAAFDTETAAIVAAIAPELAGSPADEAVLRLHTLLSDNRIRQTKWQQLTEQVEETKREIDESRVDMEATKANLKALCTEANCDHHSQMEALERRSSDHLRIKTAVDAVEHEILEAGEGASLADLEAQAQAIDADGLPGRITELHNSIEEELEPKRTQLAEAKGRETKELELMDGSDQAALLADQAQSILAGIRTDAERYMHAKLGARILRDEIERYRQENQGPLVKRASEYFSTLTLGSFDRLATDFNDKDEPVLAGIRPGEQRVYVEGMSSGTRDQLYLALRLASLEKYMESSEPMPFIVDDILVDFDDARSQAALQVLAELAERMQIILFTHHLRLVEQAQQLRGAVTLQEL